jgi:hypothetical protein
MEFNHLIATEQTYFTHFKNAMFYSYTSLKASFYFFIHGIYPDFFLFDGSKIVYKLYNILFD